MAACLAIELRLDNIPLVCDKTIEEILTTDFGLHLYGPAEILWIKYEIGCRETLPPVIERKYFWLPSADQWASAVGIDSGVGQDVEHVLRAISTARALSMRLMFPTLKMLSYAEEDPHNIFEDPDDEISSILQQQFLTLHNIYEWHMIAVAQGTFLAGL
eukprot:scaffold477253_cov59-Attheya_sp.AAC.1